MPTQRGCVAIRLPESATDKQQHELGSLARYCIRRVERELGEHGGWSVEVGATRGGYACAIAVGGPGTTLDAHAEDRDAPFAIQRAIEMLAMRLRERARAA